MILYELTCTHRHGFEGWFGSSAEFERQSEAGQIACPVCDDHGVTRAPMAPRIGKQARAPASERAAGMPATNAAPPPEAAVKLAEIIGEFCKTVEASCDYVGKEFPEEARKIHYGETGARGIYGEASKAEVVALKDEGIDIAPIPWIKKGDA